jgi:hypothetical protein
MGLSQSIKEQVREIHFSMEQADYQGRQTWLVINELSARAATEQTEQRREIKTLADNVAALTDALDSLRRDYQHLTQTSTSAYTSKAKEAAENLGFVLIRLQETETGVKADNHRLFNKVHQLLSDLVEQLKTKNEQQGDLIQSFGSALAGKVPSNDNRDPTFRLKGPR